MTGCSNGSSPSALPPAQKIGAVVCEATLAGIFITAALGSDSASISSWLVEEKAGGERWNIVALSRPPSSARAILPLRRSRLSLRGNFITVLKTAALPEFFRTEFACAEFFGLAGLIVEAGQGINRKRIAIEVIFQIENTGKAGAGEVPFAPRAVVVLLGDQILRGFRTRGIAGSGCGKKSNQSPGGLRSRAVALAFCGFDVIAEQGFAKTSIGLLHRLH